MSDEKDVGRDHGASRHGEERLDLVPNSAPHLLSFNEKTGKATRDSHQSIPIDTPAPDTVLPLPDTAGESGTSHAHTEFAPLAVAGAPGRVTVDPNVARDTTVFGSPGEPAASSLVQAPPVREKTDSRVTIEQELPQRSTVFTPVPGDAKTSSLQKTAEHQTGRSGASPAGSAAAASAPVFVPGLPATTTIVHAPPASDSASPKGRSDPRLEPEARASNNTLRPPSGGPGLQHATSASRQDPPRAPGKPAPADHLPNGGQAAPLSAAAARTVTISISGAAVERLHCEEQKTLELNKHLDQLAARLAENRH
ncbi:MAG: hypothetical protein NT123_25695 [Proteobacteria bacterium]|nr:hypothetical protein [Pseudomonadota bacterium]